MRARVRPDGQGGHNGDTGAEGSRALFANQPYSEWYLNSLRIKGSPVHGHHVKNYGEDFEYYEFAKEFNTALEAWDPAGWADLFE